MTAPHDPTQDGFTLFTVGAIRVWYREYYKFIVQYQAPCEESWRTVCALEGSPMAALAAYYQLQPGRGYRKRFGVCTPTGDGFVLLADPQIDSGATDLD